MWAVCSTVYANALRRIYDQRDTTSHFAAAICAVFSLVPDEDRDLSIYFCCRDMAQKSALLHLLGHLQDENSLGRVLPIPAKDAVAFRTALALLCYDLSANSQLLDTICGLNSEGRPPDGTSLSFIKMALSGNSHKMPGGTSPAYQQSVSTSWSQFGSIVDDLSCEYSSTRYMLTVTQLVTVANFLMFGWKATRKMEVELSRFILGCSVHEDCESKSCDYSSFSVNPKEFWRSFRMQFEGRCLAQDIVNSLLCRIVKVVTIPSWMSLCPCHDFHFLVGFKCRMCALNKGET